MKALVTGASGFVGKNLCCWLQNQENLQFVSCPHDVDEKGLSLLVKDVDIVFHLAGVNRPKSEEEFVSGNIGFTETLLKCLATNPRPRHLLFTSSIQASLDNPYGRSKLQCERLLQEAANETGARVTILRLKNLFGKWSRADYNSVTATFCYRIARDLPVQINDPDAIVDLAYIDDVVSELTKIALSEKGKAIEFHPEDKIPSKKIAVGDLCDRIKSFRMNRDTLMMPSLTDRFEKQLYATYLFFVPAEQLLRVLDNRRDQRGTLAEVMKSLSNGQIFVSSTKPGVTRGNHFHHTKVEKFIVVAGRGLIQLRQIHSKDIVEFICDGEEFRVVDIPPGYTHAITNIGSTEMVVLFWASEVFEPLKPDTFFLKI